MTGLARSDLTRPLGHRAHLPLLAGEQRDEAISLAPVSVTENDGVDTYGTEFGHF